MDTLLADSGDGQTLPRQVSRGRKKKKMSTNMRETTVMMGDPSHRGLKHFAKTIQVSQFKAFYDVVIEHFRSSDEIYEISAQKRGFYPVFFTGTFLHIVAVEYRAAHPEVFAICNSNLHGKAGSRRRMGRALSAFIVN
jgi:hypothetical protein